MTARLAALQGPHWFITGSGLHMFSQVFPVLEYIASAASARPHVFWITLERRQRGRVLLSLQRAQADAGVKCPFCRQFVQGYDTLGGYGTQAVDNLIAPCASLSAVSPLRRRCSPDRVLAAT